MFEVTLSVVVDAENLEQAKLFAVDYFHEIEEIKDEEIREMK
jgi:hypothetical protein